MRWFACLAVVLSVAASTAFGWSNKEHIQLTRIAAARLIADPSTPAEMKQWLRQAAGELPDMAGEKQYFLTARVGMYPRGADGLAWWATVPDLVAGMDRDRPVTPYGVPERQLHFTDVEFFMPGQGRQVYADDLSNKPKLTDFPRDMKDPRWAKAGMLPFRVEDCYKRLVQCIRDGKLIDTPGQFPRDEHATKWAGYLAHYLADSTQPHHSTIDYKSQSYFPGVQRAPNIHSDVEYRLMDDEDNDYPKLREEFWVLFVKSLDELKDPIEATDPWEATLQTQLISYDGLPLIGQAARAAYLDKEGKVGKWNPDAFFAFKGKYQGKEMTMSELKARQMAWAVKRIERVLRSAWDEAKAK